jgi:putative transposase
MARPLRQLVRDGWYHVFHRGTERGVIFADERDREHFLDLLAEMHIRYRIRIHAYILMDNHYHAIVQTPDANLSEGMQWLHQSHAAWYNARHERVGPFWQGRFGGVRIENGEWAYAASLYLHLNIISTREFGLGKLEKKAEGRGLRVPGAEEITRRLRTLREYRWSSWLETAELLKRAGRIKKERQARYREDVKNAVRRGGEEEKLEALRDRIAIGSESFRRQVKKMAGGGARETSGKAQLRRRVSGDDVVGVVEDLKSEKWEEFSGQRGDWGKPMAMWLMRRYGGMKLREIGEFVGGADYAAVGVMIRRFEQRANHERQIRSLMKRAVLLLNVET